MPTKTVVNCTTHEVSEVEYTAEEVAAAEAYTAASIVRKEAEAATALQREADRASGERKLKDLGLSDAEIAALTIAPVVVPQNLAPLVD